jgi:hypothetical protein
MTGKRNRTAPARAVRQTVRGAETVAILRVANGCGPFAHAADRVIAVWITSPAKVTQNGRGPGFQVLSD